ncbi:MULTISPECIES: GNAT family N-acetyltransferase [Cronobacter]|uniref:GNAT family N-acetyltransferase n=1 Tax=Cronobacter TaxID=413496 RepID=UPI00029BD856|nr:MULTISPECIES: GNAT family N-acetyltransferase [Cronobacter]CCK07708.1 GCN5-related N-acetyltransferase [Cronobacter sakazakii 696]EKK3984439.1 N-acetyltransferase [Cronobacter sakazakii]ELY2552089.1 N-acetyltransferase [Cronobacter sakazakii]ELY6003509.1 N-acetyltransferase [Cronobacter sakazakii]ELY6403243.1 N-acetyltransferase [Cronobacter sakazakii]
MAVVENLTATKAAIRDVTPGDIDAIRAIYGWHVEHGRASFEETPPTLDEMTARVSAITAQGLPWLVAEMDGIVVGYCYASPWRARPAYRYTLEESIYIDASMVGRGIGSRLLQALIERCEQGPWRQLMAVIGDGENNRGSTRLHRLLGFEVVGSLRSVGFKFGGWRDTLIMQRPLNQGDWTLPE